MIFITLLLFLIFAVISTIHFYWGFGGKWGSQAVVPTKNNGMPVFVPRTFSTFIVAVGLFCFGFFYLIKSGLISIEFPVWLNKTGFWIIIFIFTLRAVGDFNYVGYFKKHRNSQFAIKDTKYYSPLCLIIGGLTLVLELNN